jgi:hypothetical protein
VLLVEMIKLLISLVLIIQVGAETNSTGVPIQRSLNFVVVIEFIGAILIMREIKRRRGDNTLTSTSKKIDDPDAWFVQRRKRLLAM